MSTMRDLGRVNKILPLLAVLYSEMVSALPDEKLWLPESYKPLYLKLVKAALQAGNTDRCEEVLSGTIHQDRSTRVHPVFTIVCRDNRDTTYPVLIDGITFEDLTPPSRRPRPLTEAEIDAIRHEKYWRACQRELSARTRLMMDLEWLTSTMPEPEKIGEKVTRFSVNFNARDLQRRILRYRAQCAVTRLESETSVQDGREIDPKFELEVTIDPRRDP